VVDAEGIAHQRQITISHELNHLYVIYGGLKPGEKFIVDGLRKVRDGQHVEGETISAKEVIESLNYTPNKPCFQSLSSGQFLPSLFRW